MFFGVQVSLADTNIHTLDSLIQAAYASAAAKPPNRFSNIIIQADNANGGTVLVGDGLLSSTNYGNQIQKGNQLQFSSSGIQNISTLDIYVLASAATQKLNLLLMGS